MTLCYYCLTLYYGKCLSGPTWPIWEIQPCKRCCLPTRFDCSKIPLHCEFFISCYTNSLMANGMDLGKQNWGLVLLLISNLAVKSFMVPNSFQITSQCCSRISGKDWGWVCSYCHMHLGSCNPSGYVVTNLSPSDLDLFHLPCIPSKFNSNHHISPKL